MRRGWILVVVTVACASVPLKERVSNGHQLARAALVALDEAERALCTPIPATPNKCANPLAAQAGLTDARHQAFSARLVDAFTADSKVAIAIIAWKAGDPAPTDLTTLEADAQAALVAAEEIGVASGLVSKAQRFLDDVRTLAGSFRR